MAKILITGASGFVGGFLVSEALDQGLEVYAGIRKSSSKQWLQNDRINFVLMDLSDPESLKTIMAEHQFDYVIHNAGLTKALKQSDLFRVNADYSVNLANAAMTAPGLKKFSFMSSLASYGTADYQDDGVVGNHSEPKPITSYGMSKLRAEQELKLIDGLPLLIFRPTGIFGPREGDFLNLFQSINKGIAVQVGFTEQQLSLIYIKDLVRIIMQATTSDISNRAYFVSDGNLYVGSKFNRIVSNSLNKKPLNIKVPMVLIDVIATLSDLNSKITGKPNILSRDKLPEIKSRNIDIDISDLVRDFDFKPAYTLEQAVQETADWYVKEGWL
jgi:nucleoside-diphosphate-sugar epimerase